MVTKTKQWADGSSATIQYDGQGDGQIIITSDPNNHYEARSMQITVRTTDGSDIEKTVTISQAAMPNLPSDVVDLGLPSGTYWCDHNVGASTSGGYGQYFTWGDITGYAYGSGHSFSQANYNSTVVDGVNISSISTDLPLSNDAANVLQGSGYLMPTRAQFQELIDNCTISWDTVGSSTKGMRFTSNINGNSIFLPAAGAYINKNSSRSNPTTYGYYWTKTYISSAGARSMSFHELTTGFDNRVRCHGCSIRAVYKV